jgi:hypothetical protein
MLLGEKLDQVKNVMEHCDTMNWHIAVKTQQAGNIYTHTSLFEYSLNG